MKKHVLTYTLTILYFSLISCSDNSTEIERSRSGVSSGPSDSDDSITVPIEVAGSFLTFDCRKLNSSISCEYQGLASLPTKPSLKKILDRIIGKNDLDFSVYLVSNTDEKVSPETAVYLKDLTSNVNTNGEKEELELQLFDQIFSNEASALVNHFLANQDNFDSGVMLTIESPFYTPISPDEKRYAPLNNCTLASLFTNWFEKLDANNNAGITPEQREMAEPLLIATRAVAAKCAGTDQESMTKFSQGLSGLMEHFVGLNKGALDGL